MDLVLLSGGEANVCVCCSCTAVHCLFGGSEHRPTLECKRLDAAAAAAAPHAYHQSGGQRQNAKTSGTKESARLGNGENVCVYVCVHTYGTTRQYAHSVTAPSASSSSSLPSAGFRVWVSQSCSVRPGVELVFVIIPSEECTIKPPPRPMSTAIRDWREQRQHHPISR